MWRRVAISGGISAIGVVLFAVPAAADQCTNVSKTEHNALAGAQVVFDAETGEIVSITEGLENRIARGLVDPVTGEGFHGIIGAVHGEDFAEQFGTSATSTFIVTPEGHIPHQAQDNGSPDHGVVNVCDAYPGIC